MHSNIIMAQFVFHEMSHWPEVGQLYYFWLKKRKCSNHLSPQMEKISKLEIISQNHTQPTLDCATIDTFFGPIIGYHANCKYKNRISNVCSKWIAY